VSSPSTFTSPLPERRCPKDRKEWTEWEKVDRVGESGESGGSGEMCSVVSLLLIRDGDANASKRQSFRNPMRVPRSGAKHGGKGQTTLLSLEEGEQQLIETKPQTIFSAQPFKFQSEEAGFSPLPGEARREVTQFCRWLSPLHNPLHPLSNLSHRRRQVVNRPEKSPHAQQAVNFVDTAALCYALVCISH